MNYAEAIKLANKQDKDKTPYTFRCNTTILNQLKEYAVINNVGLPSLVNIILSDWCNKYVNGDITDTEYVSTKMMDRIVHIENEIEIYQNQLNKLLKQVKSIKDECNRELIKEV